jgi:hypothetical protein
VLFDDVRQYKVRRIGGTGRFASNPPEMPAQVLERIEGVEADEITQVEFAVQLLRLMFQPDILQEGVIGNQGEQFKLPRFSDEFARYSFKEHDAVAASDFGRHDRGIGRFAEK